MVSRKGLLSLIYCFLIPNWGAATERLPWVGNYLEFEWRHTAYLQDYPYVASHSYYTPYASSDIFFVASLSNAFKPEFSLEAEAMVAKTCRQDWAIDHLRLTGRYMWSNDIAGDEFSFTTGVSLTQAFDHSLHDMSSFHHGRSEAELFLSVGKEYADGKEWISRWWGVFGTGTAERGSPWFRGELNLEGRFCDVYAWRVFIHSLAGIGHKCLRLDDFHGYGSLQHQSIDLGFRYTYFIEFFGELAFEYSYRIYARNFPAKTSHLLLTLLYTFGL